MDGNTTLFFFRCWNICIAPLPEWSSYWAYSRSQVIKTVTDKTHKNRGSLFAEYNHPLTYMRAIVLNATFNNILNTSLWSVLLVEETRIAAENYRPVASHWQTLSHNDVSSTRLPSEGFELTTLMMIGTDCTGSLTTIRSRRSLFNVYDNMHSMQISWIYVYNKINNKMFHYFLRFCIYFHTEYLKFDNMNIIWKRLAN